MYATIFRTYGYDSNLSAEEVCILIGFGSVKGMYFLKIWVCIGSVFFFKRVCTGRSVTTGTGGSRLYGFPGA